MTAPNTGDGHPDLSATEARAGRRGLPVVWVLVISTVVALIAVAVVWGFFSPGLSGNGGQSRITNPVQASTTNTPTVSATTPPPRANGQQGATDAARAGANAP